MKCPSDPVRAQGLSHWPYTFDNSSYGLNLLAFGRFWNDCCTTLIKGIRYAQVKEPSLTYYIADNSDLSADPGSYFYTTINTWRHNHGLNVLWIDGHVSWMKIEDMFAHGFYGSSTEKWWDADLATFGH